MPQRPLLEALAEVPDPRADNKRHPLPAILALALAAVLGGATTLLARNAALNPLRGAGHDRIASATRYFAAKAGEALALLGLTPAPNENTLRS
jgi:DDE_Tnp_1-associated